jgi:hypothetical protein
MSLLESMRRQWAVYWEFDGQDRNGKDIFKDPIAIKVRWEDRAERDFLPTGEEVMVKSTVYVDRAMPLGGILWKGLLVDIPSIPPEHNKIRVFREIPKKDAKKFLRIARI